MNDKFTKTLNIKFSIKNVINEDGEDFSDQLTDSEVKEVMDEATEEAHNRALGYFAGELCFRIQLNDIEYEVHGWFDKSSS